MTKRILFFTAAVIVMLSSVGCENQDQDVPEIVGSATHVKFKVKPNPIVFKKPSIYKPDRQTRIAPASWYPMPDSENKTRWKGIVIHHSAAPYGDAAHEDKTHRSRGFDSLGYHFVINNGVRKNGYGKSNGYVQAGGRWRKQQKGAHCRRNGDSSNYFNEHTIGICLIGDLEKRRPSETQMQSLVKLVRFLRKRYNIPISRIQGHGDIKPTKCPGRNFPMSKFKAKL